ncbi:hypothetical protein Q7P35_006521 [Cladosporium inversicolor]
MSTNPTTQQTDVSGTVFVAALPQWKRAFWRDISVAARARNAFGDEDYDMNGDLKPHSARFAELCTWLTVRLTGAPFERLKPVWHCVADGRWELTFYAVEHMESATGVQTQTHRKTTGIVVDGLASTDQIREDWVLVRSEKVPSQEELSGEAGGRYCYIM